MLWRSDAVRGRDDTSKTRGVCALTRWYFSPYPTAVPTYAVLRFSYLARSAGSTPAFQLAYISYAQRICCRSNISGWQPLKGGSLTANNYIAVRIPGAARVAARHIKRQQLGARARSLATGGKRNTTSLKPLCARVFGSKRQRQNRLWWL